MDNILNVRIITPHQVLFEGQAESISSIDSAGPFDILPQHANFIALIENQDITVREPNKPEKKFKVAQGIVYNAKNQVSIFAEPQTI
ncbi:MAG: ATP synthase epsilon chain [Candidatus Daviesbacteria bacterium GW2011_GWA2_38_24]|uniref:ATP synthase epsilon chain n=1 Tax=Candidatus Daviesbacteria bacterium GW2011_GWA2_38_24 TaxID=1618422 RepID=A0A0G0JG98_9BACT|nr:MAG: ATP synthase epsilon chain [Candidatus Daviesbacteria bacterium GW2011_GWA2_38_24]KKQ78900.1 MAG: ATP synthase epsilon chain [Candidatus Daviesbacteria bacterium GW2011_GWA1_38_7]OGE23051.1 MAG: hypothetical protein A2688_03590 [Candidatus Daviesbacteria bacterium RIFCSPHIGHO2_01_FULL_38_8]